MAERERHPETQRALVALTLVQLFFGIHYYATKVVLTEIAPRAWAGLRASLAAVLLLLLALALRRGLRMAPADYGRLALFSIFGVIANQLLYIEGMSRTTATHASVLITGIPVGTLLFAVLLRHEAARANKILALVVSTIGVLLVVRSGTPDPSGPAPSLTGDLMILGNALSYGFFLVISKRMLTRVDPLRATALLMTFGSVALLTIGAGPLAALDPGAISPRTWLWVAFIVPFPTALGYLLNYYALKRVNASVVGLFIYLQPVIATALAVVFLGERPGIGVGIGALLIFLGVHLAVRR